MTTFPTINRRQALATLGLGGSATALYPRAAFAQGRTPVVAGVITQPKATNTNWSELTGAMKALGWVDGQNITFEWRFADGNQDREMALLREVVALKPDVVYAGNAGIAIKAKQVTATMPIVGGLGTETQAKELLGANFMRPAFNVTGTLAADVPSMTLFRYAILKEAIPGLTRFGYAVNLAGTDQGALAKQTHEAAAAAMGVSLKVVEYRGLDELPGAYEAFTRERVEALVEPAGQWQQNLPFIIAARVPSMHTDREAITHGGLMAYYASTPLGTAQTLSAALIDKILKGAKPADLAPQRVPSPTYSLAINMATAKTLGLKLPAGTFARARAEDTIA